MEAKATPAVVVEDQIKTVDEYIAGLESAANVPTNAQLAEILCAYKAVLLFIKSCYDIANRRF